MRRLNPDGSAFEKSDPSAPSPGKVRLIVKDIRILLSKIECLMSLLFKFLECGMQSKYSLKVKSGLQV